MEDTMSKRTVYTVEPDEGDWRVEKKGADRASGVFENKQDAIERARELAQQASLGQVRVKNQRGRIQFEWTYGEDPEKYPS